MQRDLKKITSISRKTNPPEWASRDVDFKTKFRPPIPAQYALYTIAHFQPMGDQQATNRTAMCLNCLTYILDDLANPQANPNTSVRNTYVAGLCGSDRCCVFGITRNGMPFQWHQRQQEKLMRHGPLHNKGQLFRRRR